MYASSKSDRYLDQRLSEKMPSRALDIGTEGTVEAQCEEVHLDGMTTTTTKKVLTLEESSFLANDLHGQHFTPQLTKKLPFVPPEFIHIPDMFEI